MKLSDTWSLCLLLLLANCASRIPRFEPAQPSLAADQVVVPLLIRNKLLFVEVALEGHGPQWFLLDTGSAATVLWAETAQEMGFRKFTSDYGIVGATGEGYLDPEAVELPALRLPSAYIGPVDAILLPRGSLPSWIGKTCQGILGFPAVSWAVVTIDVPGKRLTLSNTPLPPPNGKDVLALAPRERGVPLFDVQIGGKTLAGFFDSGYDGFVAVPGPDVEPLPLQYGPVSGLNEAVIGNKEVRTQRGRLAGSIALGSLRVDQPIVQLGVERRVQLGAEALRHIRPTFDLKRGRIRIERVGAAPIDAMPWRTAGFDWQYKNKRAVVWDVLPKSPAASAGIRAGDELLLVDETPIGDIDDEAWDALLASRKSVRFTFARDEARFVKALPIYPLVPPIQR